jgi:hypothetical protein
MSKSKVISNLFILIIAVSFVSACSFGTAITKTVTPRIRAITDEFSLTDIGSASLVVSGPEMTTQTIELNTAQMSDIFTLFLPEGEVTFDLTVNMDAAYNGSVNSYFGTTTEIITADNAEVIITLGIHNTKIIVPDFQNNRILQFDDITDSVSDSLDSSNPLISALMFAEGINAFSPYDIDLDNQGRIYIANNDVFGNTHGIIRVDNITGLNALLIPHTGGQIVALTLDRAGNLIYYSDGFSVYKNNLDGTDETVQISSDEGMFDIKGLALDNSGNIFITNNPDGGEIRKYSLSPSTFVTGEMAAVIGVSWLNAWDIMVQGTSLFVANPGGDVGEQIIELSTTDLSFIASIGNYVGSSDAPNILSGNFYGPRKFVAQLNNEITILDDSSNFWIDKIIQIDNILGDSWLTLPGTELNNGQLIFKFFDDNNFAG